MDDKHITDSYELYSFVTYLYFFAYFHQCLLQLSFLKLIMTDLIGNIFFYYIFNYNFYSFLKHNYWKHQLDNISMPQLISCASNMLVNKNANSYLYIIPINYFTYRIISYMYKKEDYRSKNIRFAIAMLFFICHLI